MNSLARYKTAISDYLGLESQQVTLYWKGRVGLFAILQALDIGPGDEVILPGFTCVVVPNAIIYRGALPIYVDIDPATFNMDLALLEAKITPKTKAIIVQNTFGLSPDFAAIQSIVQKYPLKIIEDNTHGFGSKYQNTYSGLMGDAAFFSSQWNKPFSTGIGGFVVANDTQLIDSLNTLETTLSKPSRSESLILRQQIRFRKMMNSSGLYWPAVNAYRWLSKKNIISGSSAGEELAGTQKPANYWLGASTVQAEEGLRQLKVFSENLQHRRTLANYYQSACQNLGLTPVFEPNYARHIFLKYPFFVKNRTLFLDLAAQHKIRLGEWMSSPIHPIEQQNWENWQYQRGSCPVGEKLSQHVLNLPTDPDISLVEAQRIIDFLTENKKELLASAKEVLHF